jgi:C4-dicarboxylate-specific signal transduction histidine kinase
LSQRGVESSLIRPLELPRRGSGAEPGGPEARAAAGGLELLALGGGVSPEVAAALARLGVALAPVHGDAALAERLERDARAVGLETPDAPRLVGVLLGAHHSEPEAAHFARLVRRLPQHEQLPILLPRAAGSNAPAEGAAAPGSMHGSAATPMLPLSLEPPAALESQLALLLDLHRARARAVCLSSQAEQARRDAAEASAHSAALEASLRATQAQLATCQSQLVQASKLAQLGELVAGVAHELNNPLSFALSHLATIGSGVSRGFAKLTELAPESAVECARIEERIRAVVLGTERIQSLVVKLQNFSRFDDGERHPVRVAEAIGAVLTIVEHRLGDRVSVATELHEPAVIHCSPSLIDHCVMNLVVNAIDAIEVEGRLLIKAGAEGERYVIRVLDSGPGVPDELRQRVFDPFFTTKPIGKGTGLGLSIAASIVEKHGGTLVLGRGAQGGTEAVVCLPLAHVGKPRRASAAAR